MLKERARLLRFAVFGLDLSLVAIAFVGAHWLRSSPASTLRRASSNIFSS